MKLFYCEALHFYRTKLLHIPSFKFDCKGTILIVNSKLFIAFLLSTISVDNLWITMRITLTLIYTIHIDKIRVVYIHSYITMILERFPPFFAEKRYKLINFAPEMEIVDNLSY